VGDTVRRPLRPSSAAVHDLLRRLEGAGFDGAPRFLGVDERGREILSFVDGDVPAPPYPAAVRSDEALASVARLLRRFHDAAPGWCHNDVAPYNVAYRGPEAVGLIDWDFAAPAPAPVGATRWDLAHVAWHCVPCQPDDVAADHGWVPVPDRARRLRLLCDAYGLPGDERTGFVALIVERIQATEDGIRRLADDGDPVFQALRSHFPMMRAARAFLAEDGDRLQAALVSPGAGGRA
jgi:hypothetical protein